MTVLGLHQLAMEASDDRPQALRDAGLLESALARPRFLRAYGANDPLDLTVAVVAALVQDRPFVDGNRRTAWQVLTWLLHVHGYAFAEPAPAECLSMLRGLAARDVSESEFLSWLRPRVTI